MVAALKTLAAEVKSVLPGAKVSYAADWSEYFGYQADGNVYFHLDPLWSDAHVDYIGIDNYMPLSDWREGNQHLDASWGSIYNLDYLKANIEGGEGYDWYYSDPERTVQTPLSAPYAWKNLAWFWENTHTNPDASVTDWVPESKKIWFTEYGFPSVDGATNSRRYVRWREKPVSELNSSDTSAPISS